MKFGDFIKSRRIERGITLRNFCKDIQMDPSNWSKIERGVLAPPNDPILIENLALTLALDDEQKQEMSDCADIARGQIPADLRDEEMLAKMPAFFRTMRGQEFTTEDFEKLRLGVRKLHSAV
jgi:transcriptional regulator with XRE-family HTH domain